MTLDSCAIGRLTLPEVLGQPDEVAGAGLIWQYVAMFSTFVAWTLITQFDYLLAGADETARHLGPAGLERLDEPLRETLFAYVACDLNAGATARRLRLHTNTVHYRLRRLERLTGRDVRHFPDVVDLLAAVRLRSG